MLNVMQQVTPNVIKNNPVERLDSRLKKEARKKCLNYQKKGVILSQWTDMVWGITDQKQVYKVIFNREEEKLKKMNSKYASFIENLKVFFVLRLGTCSMEVLRSMVNYIITETVKSEFYKKLVYPSEKSHGFPLVYYTEYLGLLDDVSPEYLSLCQSAVTHVQNKNAEQKRQKHPIELCEFQSYFSFDWIIRDYWDNIATEKERSLYWPLYLYWVITTVLPLRVTEFCVTPYQCIREENGHFYLTVRRSRLKGSAIKIHLYKISGDYLTYEYEIPRWIANSIEEYKKATENALHPLGLLFSAQHMVLLEGNIHLMKKPDRIFCCSDMEHLLQKFYENVISSIYHFRIVSPDDIECRYAEADDGSMEINSDEIMFVLLKHTRHLAMINLVMRGCNPIVIKDFAGHVDSAISENYYGNISKVVRCVTRNLYDRARNKRSDAVVFGYGESATMYLPAGPEDTTEVDQGECISARFAAGDAGDCLSSEGDCLRCQYLRKKYMGADIKKQENKVDNEVAFVMELLKDPALEQRLDEYQEEMLRAQESIAVLYRQYYSLEEVRDAKK